MNHLKHLFTTMLFMCCSIATAHDFVVDGIYYSITDATNNTVEVTYRWDSYSSYYNEYTGSVAIPENITFFGTTYSVTRIGSSAFNGCTGLTSIKIPNSVTSIGSSAFRGCSGLTSITIPNSVTSIGDYAFYGCNRIEELYISRSIKSIGSYAFAECNNIFIIRIGAEHLITTYENVFSEDAYINAILYVPIGTKTFYESISPWSNFYILEMDFTDIKDVKCENGIVKGVYDLHGRKIEKPINGIYIINGKKVFIK